MKNILKRIFVFFFCIIFVLNTCITTVYATELPDDEREEMNDEVEDFFGKVVSTVGNVWYYLLAQSGCFVSNGSFEDYVKNDSDFVKAMDAVWNKNNVQVKIDKDGKKSVVFSKVITDTLLNSMKDLNKKPDNGGYELIKTVPVNKVSALYFNDSTDYRSMYDLVKDNGGIMGLYYSGGSAFFYKVDPKFYCVRGNSVSTSNKIFRGGRFLENVNNSYITFNGYNLIDKKEVATAWDSENLGINSYYRNVEFMFYDWYSAYVNYYSGNPLSTKPCIISSTGVSIPVFNSLKDLVAYTVANNLYYTTSDYTGEGAEVTIDYDELDKILSGYYSGMYDMLQRLIEQNGGNALTPEQVQELADQVAESFDMLKTEINNGFEEQDKLIQANSNLLVSIRSILGDGIEELKKLHTDANGILESMLENMGLHFADITGKIDEIFYDATGVSVLGILNENVMSAKDALGNIVDEIRNLSNSTGSPPDGFVENVYQFFTDIINKFDEIFYDDSGRNVFDVISENIKNIEFGPSSSPPIIDNDGNMWDFLDFVTGLGEKALDEAERDVDDLVDSLFGVFDSCLELIKTRFPFSIPWDIVAIIAVLSAEPEAPVFDIPLKLERYGIDTSIKIDFSNFSVLSDISRSFLTLIWCMYLMNYTVKFTDLRSK